LDVPFIDLHGQLDDCREVLEKDIIDVVRSCRYILGDRGRALEEAVARESGAKHAIGVASGTDALIFALDALGLQRGRKVVVPAFTFCASVSAIIRAGGEPLFVDIDERTFNLDIEQAINADGDIAGYLPVHLYGLPAEINALVEFAHKNGRFVLEDCAQAYGATLDGHPVGSIGDAGILSFYPTKNLSAIGDAGMILSNDDEAAKLCRLLRNHGEEIRYHHSVLGRNSRLDEIQAAALLAKLPFVVKWNERRREIARMYIQGLNDIDGLILPHEPPRCRHVYNLYVVRTSRRDQLNDFLKQRGIGTGLYYPVGMHKQPIFRKYVPSGIDFPITEKACETVLALPMFPHLDDAQVDYVIKSIREFFQSP
jgi:dTDP-4-amino-4,6-dideoxygalactose transaminase